MTTNTKFDEDTPCPKDIGCPYLENCLWRKSDCDYWRNKD